MHRDVTSPDQVGILRQLLPDDALDQRSVEGNPDFVPGVRAVAVIAVVTVPGHDVNIIFGGVEHLSVNLQRAGSVVNIFKLYDVGILPLDAVGFVTVGIACHQYVDRPRGIIIMPKTLNLLKHCDNPHFLIDFSSF